MDREAWRAAIHGVAKIWTLLSNWTELKWTEEEILPKESHKKQHRNTVYEKLMFVIRSQWQCGMIYRNLWRVGKANPGTSLAAQWLTLNFHCRGVGSVSGQGLEISHVAVVHPKKKKKANPFVLNLGDILFLTIPLLWTQCLQTSYCNTCALKSELPTSPWQTLSHCLCDMPHWLHPREQITLCSKRIWVWKVLSVLITEN